MSRLYELSMVYFYTYIAPFNLMSGVSVRFKSSLRLDLLSDVLT